MKKITKKHVGLISILAVLLMSFSQYKIDFFEIAKQIEIYNTLFKEINMGYVDQTNPAELMESGVKHMLSELDPYTIYSSEQDVENAKMFRSGTYANIGVELKIIKEKLIVTELFKGYSADSAGIKVGDEIIEIDGVAVSEVKNNIELLIGGNKNSEVEVIYSRNGEKTKATLLRENKQSKAVPIYQMLDHDIGYISLERFSGGSSMEVESALKFLLIDNAKGLILDLRNNPGGILQEAVNIVNLFVPKNQIVVSTQSNIEKHNSQFFTKKQPLSLDIPIVILINERSASASEIVAGALQDLDRGVIIGRRSFGKGLVQQSKPLPYGGQLKVTISRYYTPSGRCIQALNYSENLESGVVRRMNSKNKTIFKTKNGRTVYDGGGVMPDVSIGQSDELGVFNALKNNNIIFDFVTKYQSQNQIKELEQFELDPAVFKDFKAFCMSQNFDLNTKTELYLNQSIAAAKDENLKTLETYVSSIKEALSEQKKQAITDIKEQVLWGISEEIIRRKFYEEGVYQYTILKDQAIQEAKQVLINTSDYYEILK